MEYCPARDGRFCIRSAGSFSLFCTALHRAVLRLFAAQDAAAQDAAAQDAHAPADREAQAKHILDTYGNSILRYAYSYVHNMSDAEDVLQDTLIQFLKAGPVFENGRHEKAWLLRVAGNLSKSRIRYNAIRKTDELHEELAAEQREDLSFVWEAVQSLPVKYREAIHLFYHEGFSTRQIADILQKKEATVRSDLHRGRAALKDILKEAYDFETV